MKDQSMTDFDEDFDRTDFDEFRNLCQEYEDSPDIATGAQLQEFCENLDDKNPTEAQKYNQLVDEFPWVFDQIGYGKIGATSDLADLEKNIEDSENWKDTFEPEALRQGWTLFTTDDGTLRIQKVDDPDNLKEDYELNFDVPELTSDDEAIEVAFRNAAKGNMAALLGLYWHGQKAE